MLNIVISEHLKLKKCGSLQTASACENTLNMLILGQYIPMSRLVSEIQKFGKFRTGSGVLRRSDDQDPKETLSLFSCKIRNGSLLGKRARAHVPSFRSRKHFTMEHLPNFRNVRTTVACGTVIFLYQTINIQVVRLVKLAISQFSE